MMRPPFPETCRPLVAQPTSDARVAMWPDLVVLASVRRDPRRLGQRWAVSTWLGEFAIAEEWHN